MSWVAHLIALFYAFSKYIFLFEWTQKTTGKVSNDVEFDSNQTFELWRRKQIEKDEYHKIHAWSQQDKNNHYDYGILRSLKDDLEQSRLSGDQRSLNSQLRSYTSRNICRILSPNLYRKSKIQTKHLIEDYILEVCRCIRYIARRDINAQASSIISLQEKWQLLHDMKRSLGRTTLVLQGGANISLSHFGVVKALQQHHLLPQIITGTGTGSFIAAIVSIATEEELKEVLQGHKINVDAFQQNELRRQQSEQSSLWPTWIHTLIRRWERYRFTGHIFNIEVIRECARENLGDLTFEEAYARTARILNITIAMPEDSGTPQLLNYITAPHVLIWSAVVASISTSKEMYAPARLFCKAETGAVTQFFAPDSSETSTTKSRPNHEAPLQRLGELFNANHFIISQTRPYVFLFLRLQRATEKYWIIGKLTKLVLNECLHWLAFWGRCGLLPTSLHRVLVDEVVPSIAPWSKFSIIPQVNCTDLVGMFDSPSAATLAKWTARGEKSTWPTLCELKVRCAIEVELESVSINFRRRQTYPFTNEGDSSSA